MTKTNKAKKIEWIKKRIVEELTKNQYRMNNNTINCMVSNISKTVRKNNDIRRECLEFAKIVNKLKPEEEYFPF